VSDGAAWESPGVDWSRPDPRRAVPTKRPSPNLIIDFLLSAGIAAALAWVAVIALAVLFGVYH
jgi:hypothetical protein